MLHRIWPSSPDFQSDGEREVFDLLKKSLSEHDALLANIRFTDPQEGDIEIDLVALVSGVGAIVIENKGGHISYNGQNWLQSDSSGSRKINPHQQVLANVHALRSFLRSNWAYGNLKAEWLLAFPSSLLGQTKVPGVPRSRIVDKAEMPQILDYGIQALQESLGHWAPHQTDWVEKAFKALKGSSIYETDREIALFNSHNFVRNQTHERKNILNMIQENHRIYIKGPAGSGKTWLAFEQSKIWADQGLKVGIMTFNRGLESYMQRKNTELGAKRKAHWVGTFHNFMKQAGQSAPMQSVYEQNPKKFDEKMITAARNLPEIRKFDAWIVDEAQDFHDSWWEILNLTLKNPEAGRLAIFGDPKQSVFGKRGVPKGNFFVVNLAENLRNSQQIAEAVGKFVDGQIIMRGPQSYEIEYIFVETVDEVVDAASDALAKLTDEERWIPSEIALLTTKHQHPVHKLKANDIEAYWKEFWQADSEFYATVSGFKGLEKSAVVLAIDGFHEEKNPKDVLYVGMSRARDRLIIVCPNEYRSLVLGQSEIK